MHTTELGSNWIALHNGQMEEGDYITLRRLSEDGRNILEDHVLPYEIIRSFVADQVRNARIEQLERMSDTEILGDFLKDENS